MSCQRGKVKRRDSSVARGAQRLALCEEGAPPPTGGSAACGLSEGASDFLAETLRYMVSRPQREGLRCASQIHRLRQLEKF